MDINQVTTTSLVLHASNDTVQQADALGCTAEDLELSPPLRYILMLFGSMLITENASMISTIARHQKLHSNTNILVASLAFSDVIIGLLCLLLGLVAEPGGLRSTSGVSRSDLRIFDSLAVGGNCSLIVVSTAHLAVLSVDRYLYLLWPLTYSRRVTKRCVMCTAAVIWTFGCVYMVLPVWLYSDPKYHKSCIIFDSPIAYAIGPMLGVFFLCTVIVCASTFGIAKLALKHDRKRQMRRNGGVEDKNMKRKHAKEIKNHHVSSDSNIEQEPLGNFKEAFSFTAEIALAIISSGQIDPSTSYDVTAVCHCQADFWLEGNIGENGILNDLNPCIGCDRLDLAHVDTTHCSVPFDTNQAKTPSVDSLKNTDECVIVSENRPSTSSLTTTGICVGHKLVFKDNAENVQESNILPNEKRQRTSLQFSKLNTKRNQQPLQETHKNSEPRNPTERKIAKPFNKAQLKILKFVLMVFGCYMVCVCPTLVHLLFDRLFHAIHFSNSTVVWTTMFLFTNSGVNFLIMARMNKNFREALMNSFPGRYLKIVKRCRALLGSR